MRKYSAAEARQRRIHRGVDQELAARQRTSRASLQGLMQMPLLEAIEDAGGKAKPGDVYERLAAEFALDDAALAERRTCADGQSYHVFFQQCRWARQTAVMNGLVSKEKRGVWQLTDKAYGQLDRARAGAVVLVYSLDSGFALWARAEDAAGVIEPASCKLILTSPPYPVVQRSYGRYGVAEWLDWMNGLLGLWRSLLTEDGTLAVNLMDVFIPGSPALSPYGERFLLNAVDRHHFSLAGRFHWHSPTKLGNIQWTVKERVRPKNSMEQILLLSKCPNPDWDIGRLPVESYASRSASSLAADKARAGRSKRPSGYDINEAAFQRGSGPLPGNLIVAGGATGSDHYSRAAKAAGLPLHPARFPEEIPRRTILLATKESDTVYDPMAGSNTTGKVARDSQRALTLAPQAVIWHLLAQSLAAGIPLVAQCRYCADLAAGAPLRATGTIETSFHPRIAESAEEAVVGADAVMPAMPGYAHKLAFDAIAPHLREGQPVIISSHCLLRRALPCAVAGRKASPTEAAVNSLRAKIELAAVPERAAAEARALCTTLFGERFVPREGLLAIALSNLNPQNHLAIALFNLTRMERGESWGQVENVTPAVGRVMEALDAERLAIAEAWQVRPRHRNEDGLRSCDPSASLPGVFGAVH